MFMGGLGMSITCCGRAVIASFAVAAAYTLSDESSARAAVPSMQSGAAECVPGRIVDFCSVTRPAHGFLLDQGMFTAIDAPGATTTVLFRVRNRGQIVGACVLPDETPGGTTHGLLVDNGVVKTIDAPGPSETELLGINDCGQIVGTYSNAPGGAVAASGSGSGVREGGRRDERYRTRSAAWTSSYSRSPRPRRVAMQLDVGPACSPRPRGSCRGCRTAWLLQCQAVG
ncbi:MAG: hypothetical protein A2V77_05505 [Anaeromyxobacter sp. RBG_16_69_14]|nr:MAG: hypothetical protein A2V77_05505 [Anaeromyxobacter sp. RBG_16_69_14]